MSYGRETDNARRAIEKAYELLDLLGFWSMPECDPAARRILDDARRRCAGDEEVVQSNLVAALILSLQEQLRRSERARYHPVKRALKKVE